MPGTDLGYGVPRYEVGLACRLARTPRHELPIRCAEVEVDAESYVSELSKEVQRSTATGHAPGGIEVGYGGMRVVRGRELCLSSKQLSFSPVRFRVGSRIDALC
eukprot:3395892-Rhodomonas_salina.1